MSQNRLEVQRLEALLRQKEALLRQNAEEARAIEDELNRARCSVSTAPLDFDPNPGTYHVASPCPSLDDHGRSTSDTIPRTASNTGVPGDMGPKIEPGHSQQLQDQTRPMKRSKTAHHGDAASSNARVARSASNASTSMTMTTARPNLFVSKGPGPVTPPYPSVPRSSYSGSEMLHDYLNQDQFQQPANAFIHADSLYSSQHIGRPAEPLLVQGRELEVADFLSMRDDDEDICITSPVPIPTSALLSPESAHFPSNSAIPSACGSMTSGPTIETAPMTRSNSTMNDNASILGQFSELVRIRSQQSSRGNVHQDNLGHSKALNHAPLLGKRPAMLEPDLAAMGTNLHDLTHGYGSSAPIDSRLLEHQHLMQKSVSQSSTRSSSSIGLLDAPEFSAASLAQHLSMERSLSKDSVRSNQSLKHRAKEALSRQNINALSRNLQPKPAGDLMKREAVEPASSRVNDGKTIIAKAKYERPKHPKVKCSQCNENPEGFRGEHELRRHTEAKHKSTVKKWVCRDPAEAGIPHTETAMKPLRSCKQCTQSKQYGAYYNAAAHLRRTHFKVKPARKGAAAKNGAKGSNGVNKDGCDEKRGGKGGGDWPPMAELKLWMVEVSVPMEQEGALMPDSADSVGALDQEDIENELVDPMAAYGSQSGARVGFGQDTYDLPGAFAGVGGGFTPDLDVDPSFQAVQGELGSQSTDLFIDTSLYPATPLHNLSMSSASFDYHPSTHATQHHMSSSLMSIDGHNYSSPVSSTATITQAGVFVDHHMLAPSHMHLARDDLNELSFDLTFAAGQ